MKRYRVECVQRYLDGSSQTEVIWVMAFDWEHAEEKAFRACGGEYGNATNMVFRARQD